MSRLVSSIESPGTGTRRPTSWRHATRSGGRPRLGLLHHRDQVRRGERERSPYAQSLLVAARHSLKAARNKLLSGFFPGGMAVLIRDM